MASNKKAKYRSLISRLQGVAGNIDSASETIDNIQPELNEGILINDNPIETEVFPEAKTALEDAKNSLYRAIRSCYTSMSRCKDEEES